MGAKSNVLELSKTNPEVLTNYNSLLLNYWLRYDNIRNMSDIAEATSSETIGRAFRFLVSEGLIKVPRFKAKQRAEAFEDFKEEYSR
jgi:hypothetical protein